MIKHIIVFFKIFLLFEFAIMGSGLIIWGFFDLLSYIKYREIHLNLLYKLIKAVSFASIFASLIFWFGYYLFPTKEKNTIKEDDYKNIVNCSKLRPLNELWNCISPDMLPSLKFSEDKFPFQGKKELFFYFLNRLLQEGYLKLAKNKQLLEVPIDQQLKLFYEAFPKTENEMFDKQKLMDDYWFFDDSCPAEAVWVLEDGSLKWT